MAGKSGASSQHPRRKRYGLPPRSSAGAAALGKSVPVRLPVSPRSMISNLTVPCGKSARGLRRTGAETRPRRSLRRGRGIRSHRKTAPQDPVKRAASDPRRTGTASAPTRYRPCASGCSTGPASAAGSGAPRLSGPESTRELTPTRPPSARLDRNSVNSRATTRSMRASMNDKPANAKV